MLDINIELNIIFGGIDDHLDAGNFNIVDLILSQVVPDDLPPEVCLGFLSTTIWAQGKLQHRFELREKIRKRMPDENLWRRFSG